MRAKTVAALTLVGGLLLAPSSLPAVAKGKPKAKKPPARKLVPMQKKFFLRQTEDCIEHKEHLSLTDGPDLECWTVDDFASDVYAPTNLIPLVDVWPAADGVPFTLNVSKPITGKISVGSADCLLSGVCAPFGVGVGRAQLDVVLEAQIDGATVSLGEFHATYEVVPDEIYTFDLNMKLPASLRNQTVRNLTLSTFTHGPVVNHGIVQLDDPASYVSLPALVRK